VDSKSLSAGFILTISDLVIACEPGSQKIKVLIGIITQIGSKIILDPQF